MSMMMLLILMTESSKDFKGDLRPENIANSDASATGLHDKESSSFDSVNRSLSNEKINTSCIKQDYCRSAPHQAYSNSNLSIIHPVRTLDEGGGNCLHSRNDTVSSFEFHRVERIIQQPSLGLFSGHVPSKWNDAEKWIINRQIASPSVKKKTPAQKQGSHQTSSLCRLETDSTIAEHKASVVQALDSMRNEFNQTASQDVVEKFSFVPHASNNKAVESVDSSPYSGTSGSCSRSGEDVNHQEFSIMKRHASEPTGMLIGHVECNNFAFKIVEAFAISDCCNVIFHCHEYEYWILTTVLIRRLFTMWKTVS